MIKLLVRSDAQMQALGQLIASYASLGDVIFLVGQLGADKYNISRKEQDDFAIESCKRAQEAIKQDAFTTEIAPIAIKSRKKIVEVHEDETISSIDIEKITCLPPAFIKEGTVTAANASSIADGAAALLLMRASKAKQLQLKPLARILGHAFHAAEPEWFTTAPVDAINKLINKINWSLNDVDLFEINEAFSVVTLTCMQQLKIPHHKVNVNGGACCLGHPIGATGSRIIITLLHALQQRNLNKGIASLCIGGGEATAIAIELMPQ